MPSARQQSLRANRRPSGKMPVGALAAEESQRAALLVEYCGSDFYGSQYQPNRPTIQSAIQDALSTLNVQTSAVSFAGRTDAGVNALGQVAHVDIRTNALDNVADLTKALNAVLPTTIAIRQIRLDAGRTFNSRRDARYKWYRYQIHNAPHRSVMASRSYATHIHQPLDSARMHHAAQMLIGRHDFTSFQDADTDVRDTLCDVRYAHVHRLDNQMANQVIAFDIVANRFLYKMVRNLAGQLVAIGKGTVPSDAIRDVLAAHDRQACAATARPEGLCLMAVGYDGPFAFFQNDPAVRRMETLLLSTASNLECPSDENLFRKAS